MKKATTLLALAMIAAQPATAALSCGFEDPAAMRKGFLNIIFPKALHVDTAVWQQQQAGRLPADPPVRPSRLLQANPAYSRALRTLQGLASVDPAAAGGTPVSFVVLLLEGMLWSRISIDESGTASLTPHIDGTNPGEAVLITHRVVLDSMSAGTLTLGEAVDLGVLRTYGDEVNVSAAVTFLGGKYQRRAMPAAQ
jgi:hypothetical protein